ncbi:MAG: hypothetical protein ABSH16_12170 [Sedimentisphaerales bacterium]
MAGVNPGNVRKKNRSMRAAGERNAEKVTRLSAQGDVGGDCQYKNSSFVECEWNPNSTVKLSHHLFAEAGTLTPQPHYTFAL